MQIYKSKPIFMCFESCNSFIIPCTCHYTIVDRPIISTKMKCNHWLKSLWDVKSEIGSLHFSDFTLVKVILL